jgi:hypothetical protein
MSEAKFFERFPITTATVRGVSREITDISRSVVVNQDIFDKSYHFYDYVIGEGERPDHVAFSEYGSSSLAWIILLTNKIYDVWRQWPLSYEVLNRFIISKYGSINNASTIVHEFRTIEDNIVIDEITKNMMNPNDYRIISKLEFERELNDSKRQIRLIQEQFIPELKKELEGLFEV